VGHWWNDTGGKTEELRDKPEPVPLCPQRGSQLLREGRLKSHLVPCCYCLFVCLFVCLC